MGSFEIRFKHSAEADLKKIDRQFLPKILAGVETLSNNPFPSGCRKITGSESSFRVRAGDYRIIYQVDSDQKEIVIFHIRHRKDAYK